MQLEYRVKFPKERTKIREPDITFHIGNLKCNTQAVIYYIFHGFNAHNEEIFSLIDPVDDDKSKPVHTGKRQVVCSEYNSYTDTFTLSEDVLNTMAYTQIELVLIGIDDNNPLVFNNCMLTDKMFSEYHAPDEKIDKSIIDMIKTPYANLYSNISDDYLQVIRPYSTSFFTDVLSKSQMTILAPHLENEAEIDAPNNILMEVLNQVEQTTNISMDSFNING